MASWENIQGQTGIDSNYFEEGLFPYFPNRPIVLIGGYLGDITGLQVQVCFLGIVYKKARFLGKVESNNCVNYGTVHWVQRQQEPRFCQFRDFFRLSWAIVHVWWFKIEKYEIDFKLSLKTEGNTRCLKKKIHAESCQNKVIMPK